MAVSSTKSTQGAAAALRWRKLARRAGLAAAGLLVLVAVVFFLLPVWISNEQGRIYVLDRLNRRLSMGEGGGAGSGPRVTVDEWSVGWFRGTELKNVRILQPDGTPLLSSPHVMSGLTLWDLVWGNYDLRNTTAENLEMRIVKFADGTTSLDSFTQGAGDMLRSLRGALQINGAQVEIVSARTGQSVRYVDVKATITIASADAPFHVQVAGLSPSGSSVTLSATLPPTHTLSGESWTHPGVWGLVGDMDVTVTRLPTAMVCDYLKMDPAWSESLGERLEAVQFSGHPSAAQDGTRLTLFVQGSSPGGGPAVTGGPGNMPMLSARVLLLTGTGKPEAGMITVAGAEDRMEAALRMSPPLSRLLEKLNPVLGETAGSEQAGAAGLLHGNITSLVLKLDATQLESAEGSARLTFPALVFTPRDGPSLVRQLEVIGGEMPRPGAGARIEGSAGLMRLFLKDRQFSYDNFLVGLGRTKINFSGTVGLDGGLDLQATIPSEGTPGGLSAGWTKVTIVGTVDNPLVNRN